MRVGIGVGIVVRLQLQIGVGMGVEMDVGRSLRNDIGIIVGIAEGKAVRMAEGT